MHDFSGLLIDTQHVELRNYKPESILLIGISHLFITPNSKPYVKKIRK